MALPPGLYRIVNLAPGNLAVQYNGPNLNLTVTPQAPAGEEFIPQTWIVVGPAGGPQSISPLDAPVLQTQPAGGFVQPQLAPFQWNIVPGGGPGIFQIQTIGMADSWGIAVALVGEPVVLGAPVGPMAIWNFILVGPLPAGAD